MARLKGTLAPVNRAGRYGGNRNGLNLSSCLVGTDAHLPTADLIALQGWAEQVLRAVDSFHHRQRRRAESDRAMLAMARKAVARG